MVTDNEKVQTVRRHAVGDLKRHFDDYRARGEKVSWEALVRLTNELRREPVDSGQSLAQQRRVADVQRAVVAAIQELTANGQLTGNDGDFVAQVTHRPDKPEPPRGAPVGSRYPWTCSKCQSKVEAGQERCTCGATRTQMRDLIFEDGWTCSCGVSNRATRQFCVSPDCNREKLLIK